MWTAPAGAALLFASFAAWRASRAWRRRDRGSAWWTPHFATVSIGLDFLTLLVLEGAWAYADALAELARGMAGVRGLRIGLFGCLLAGAMFGGWHAGQWRRRWPTVPALL